MTHTDCTRKRVEIDGNNYYLMVSDTWVDLTMAFENREDNIKQRILLDTICEEISTVMALRHMDKTREDCAGEIITKNATHGMPDSYFTGYVGK